MQRSILLFAAVKHGVTGRRLIVLQRGGGGMWGLLRVPHRFPLPSDARTARAVGRLLLRLFPSVRVENARMLRLPHTVGSLRVVKLVVRGSFDEFNPCLGVRGAMDLESPEVWALDALTRAALPNLNGKE